MGDRCYLEITLRRSDLDRFGKHLDAAPGAEWYDHLSEEEDCPGVVTASVHEANYAWFDERAEAARAGIPFYGRHDSGDEYGPYCFASWNRKMREAPLDHDGNLSIAVDEDLKPIGDPSFLRRYIRTLKKVKAAFAKAEVETLERAA